MKKVGVFLESGGNKVFFVNGVLKVFQKENIHIDHLIGMSSSSAIIFVHLFSCHDYILNIFGKMLRENEKNFYPMRKNKFPHNDIYKKGILSIFNKKIPASNIHISYSIIATQTNPAFKKLKGGIATLAMIIDEYGLNATCLVKRLFNISEISYDSRISPKLSDNDLLNLIMGSSTIYPFIKLHTLNGKLILEGKLAKIDPVECLEEFEKKIIIHTEKGVTKIKNNILHIYSSQKIPNNILDYTDDTKIKILQKNGEKEALENINLIKNYLQ